MNPRRLSRKGRFEALILCRMSCTAAVRFFGSFHDCFYCRPIPKSFAQLLSLVVSRIMPGISRARQSQGGARDLITVCNGARCFACVVWYHAGRTRYYVPGEPAILHGPPVVVAGFTGAARILSIRLRNFRAKDNVRSGGGIFSRLTVKGWRPVEVE